MDKFEYVSFFTLFTILFSFLAIASFNFNDFLGIIINGFVGILFSIGLLLIILSD